MNKNSTHPQQPTRHTISGSAPEGRLPLHRTACFNCRASRLKCDRQSPCVRCASQQKRCEYPQVSNRGRKQGSYYSKPDTVEKLLQRINDSPVGEQVIAAILASSRNLQSSNSASNTIGGRDSTEHTPDTEAISEAYTSVKSEEYVPEYSPTNGNAGSSLVSPLHILADAVETERLASLNLLDSAPNLGHYEEPLLSDTSNAWLSRQSTERLIKYFRPSSVFQKDWQVLAAQPLNAPVRLTSLTCDPISSRIINDTDAERYFDLYFKIRNPLVCLLDPVLHRPEIVRPLSFTLFSVICALGCAVANTQRDRVLYPSLLALAECNIKWSIATSVKSVETVQAIFTMEYWSPVHETQKDDPYWLHISHAILLARELGLKKDKAVEDLVSAYTSPTASSDFKERFRRNIERTWLAAFFAEKSFGIVTGRVMNVGRSEISESIFDWWKKPMACPFDRVTTGVVEMRILLMQYLEERQQMTKTRELIEDWQARGFEALQTLREKRCIPDTSASSEYLPILAHYMDHSILVLNANALRDFVATNAMQCLANPCKISRQTVDVACRSLTLILSDPVLLKHMYGTHNNMLIMICHALSEILFATTRGCLPPDMMEAAANKVRAVTTHLETLARGLPSTSAASLYTTLSNVLSKQLDKYISTSQASTEVMQESIPTDWWNALGGDMLVDMNDLFPQQLFPELAGNGNGSAGTMSG
ncbi:hypothetical protein KCU81_g3372, partial [Aureobasidium melanogenum]